MTEAFEQDELTTLEAELRQAVQQQRAAYEQMVETQREVEQLMERANTLLARVRARTRAPSPTT